MQLLLHFQRASSLASMSLFLLAAPSLGGSDTLLPGKTEAWGPPDSTLCPGSPHTMGTPGDMDTGFATPPAQQVLGTPAPIPAFGVPAPQRPRPATTRPRAAPGEPQGPPAPVGTWCLQSTAEHQLINPPVMTSLFLTRRSRSRELR